MKPVDWRRTPAGRFLRHIPRIKHLRGSWLHRRLGDRFVDPALWHPDRERVARGLAVGAFFSMLPIPLQSIPAAVMAFFARANIPCALVACWITNPITAAFFLLAQVQVGFFVLGRGSAWQAIKDHSTLEVVKSMPLPLLSGAVLMGTVLSVVAYLFGGILYDLVVAAVRASRARVEARRKIRGLAK